VYGNSVTLSRLLFWILVWCRYSNVFLSVKRMVIKSLKKYFSPTAFWATTVKRWFASLNAWTWRFLFLLQGSVPVTEKISKIFWFVIVTTFGVFLFLDTDKFCYFSMSCCSDSLKHRSNARPYQYGRRNFISTDSRFVPRNRRRKINSTDSRFRPQNRRQRVIATNSRFCRRDRHDENDR